MVNLFVRILHMGISASYLILAVLAVRFLLKKAPKAMRIFLWLLVGIRLVLPFSVESAFSLLPDTQPVTERIDNMRAQQPTPDTGLKPPDTPSLLPAEDRAHTPSVPQEGQHLDAPFYLRLGAGIWAAGMAMMAGYLLISWIRLTGRVRTAVPADIALDDAHTVRVYQSERIDGPFLFGIVRPRIYIPEHLAKNDVPYVVLHEETHRRRNDHLIKLSGFLILGVYWFHPLVWAAWLMLCRDIELICDEQVIRRLGEPHKKAYSQALLDSAAARGPSACPVAFGEVGVRERVKNVLYYKKPALWVILTAILACMLVPVCFMTQPKADASQPDANAPSGISDAGSPSDTDKGNPSGGGFTDPQLTPDSEVEESLPAEQNREAIERWAQAFCERDGKAIAGMLAEDAKQELTDQCNFTRFEDGSVELGFSSPWPWAANWEDPADAKNYRIVSLTDSSAEILYYAWVSDPHVTVWREQLTYRMMEDRCEITSESIQFLDAICTAVELEQAYPGLVIADTMMDYSLNGAGEIWNSRPDEALHKPDTAAVCLLNLLNNQNKVSTEVLASDTDENLCTVAITFHLPPQKTVRITMTRPYGPDGIWVPYNGVWEEDQSAENN